MRAWGIALVGWLAACGGSTVVGPGGDGGGGSGGDATTSGSGGSPTGSSSSGMTGCTTHDDCPGDDVCLFGTGQCAPSCGEFCDACDPGTVCDGCATGSCPGCADCVAACVPIQDGMCDENDPCPNGEVCLHEQRVCAPPCTLNGTCDDPGLQCNDCVTGSCCGCEDCVAACM
ncbi:MAG: hypothetical protein RIF41_06360 [Polyangiaceae bacterium]